MAAARLAAAGNDLTTVTLRLSHAELERLGAGDDRESYVEYALAFAKTTRESDEFVDGDPGNDLFMVGDSYGGDLLNDLNEGGWLEGVEVLSHKISWDCHNVPASADYAEHIE